MTAPAIDWTRCLHCQGKGYVARVVCRTCHGHGCARCDGTGLIGKPSVCHHCHGSGKRTP